MKNISIYFKEITQAEYKYVDKKLEKYNLVKGQAVLLSTIKENDGATQNKIAEIMNIKYSSLSERITKLEELGYICRIADDTNLKYKKVFITQSGKKAATQCNRILNDFETKLYKGFTKKEEKAFDTYLTRMKTNVKNKT